MLKFNELRITPEDKRLIIDVSVIDSPYYEDISIDSIIVDNQDTHTNNGPSSSPIFIYEDGVSSEITVTGKEERRVRLEIPSTILSNLDSDLFFVYATAKGTPSSDTPCGMDSNSIVGVAFDLYKLQQLYMYYIKGIDSESCSIQKSFIDHYLRFKAFKLALITGNHILAIKYWNKFFKKIKSYTLNSKCPCSNV